MGSVIVHGFCSGTRQNARVCCQCQWTEIGLKVHGLLLAIWQKSDSANNKQSRDGGMPRVESGGEKTRDARATRRVRRTVFDSSRPQSHRDPRPAPAIHDFSPMKVQPPGPRSPSHLHYLPINLGEKVQFSPSQGYFVSISTALPQCIQLTNLV